MESFGLSLLREQYLGARWARAECLRFFAARQVLSQAGMLDVHLKDCRLCKTVKPGSGTSCWMHICMEKKEKLLKSPF